MKILWRDCHQILISKPASIHTENQINFEDSIEKMINNNNDLKNYSFLSSRLDYETNGLLWAYKKKFEVSHPRLKLYITKVEGAWPLKNLIEYKTGFQNKGKSGEKVLVKKNVKEKIVRSCYILPLEIESDSSKLAVWIERGFRHQIRSQLASLGFPIRNDSLYGQGEKKGDLLLQSYGNFHSELGWFNDEQVQS